METMTYDEIRLIQNQITELEAQLKAARIKYDAVRHKLIGSVTAKQSGRTIKLTTASGAEYITQTESDNQWSRSIKDAATGKVVAADVRGGLDLVKLFVAQFDLIK